MEAFEAGRQVSWLAAADSYTARRPMSDPEQALFRRLEEAMPECIILSQVPLSRFLAPAAKGFLARRRLLNRISGKSADFLVCLPDFTVVAVVELDDRTHTPARDSRRDVMVREAGIPVVRVQVTEMPTVEYLRALFTR
jgi:hypothetical protein